MTWPLAAVTATAMVSPSILNDTAEPDAFATRFPEAKVRSTPGSVVAIELPSISTGLSSLPGVVNCAIPSGMSAYTEVAPENFSLLLRFFFFLTPLVVVAASAG